MTQWKCFVQTHLHFVTTYGLMWSSSVTFKHKMTLVHSNVSLVTRHHFITAHKRSLQRLCFYSCLSVILFTGGSASVHAGIPPGTRHSPPARSRHPQEQTPRGPGTPTCAVHAGRYGQQARGTHPTGMQSCLVMISHKKNIVHPYTIMLSLM